MASRMGRRVERQLLWALARVAVVSLVALALLLVGARAEFGWVDSTRDFSIIAGALLLVTVVLAAAVVRSTLRHRLRPLQHVHKVIHLVMRGNYSRRVPIARADDFQPLTRAFNDLVDQLAAASETSQAVADIDRLMLSSAGLDPVIRKVLTSARMDGMEVALILRVAPPSERLTIFRLEKKQVKEEAVGLVEISDQSLDSVAGYQHLAEGLCDGELRECLPIAPESSVSGVLVATGRRPLTSAESKRLADLADRLAVAMTNIKRSESLYHQAHFDGLTGLINRRAFEDRLQECLARSWRGEEGAVLFIDLDHFKKVNDTEGHKAGDRLLVEISERLKTTLREVDTIARLGGDEFAVIITGMEEEKAVTRVCERIVAAIVKPIVVERLEHAVGASIGVALFPEDGQSVDELVMKADSAMYRAKESGGAGFAFFDDTLNAASRHRVLVESRLRKALEQRTLEMHFQPKLRLSDNSVTSCEALMRWTDAELGEVEPSTFVPVAEETNLIHEFTDVLVSKTADLLLQADRAGVHLDHVALNASARQLMSEGFASRFLGMLDQRNLPHHNVQIEVTESVFAGDTKTVVGELDTLRRAGVRIALDDFGTGYSSLNMLRELPLDVVKIDRSFVSELDSSEQGRILVRHLISIVDALGKEVVAEGVETEKQLQYLRDADCEYVQGFLISKAKPAADFIRLVADWRTGHNGTLLKLVT
ncbi:MAG: EAL domain-containing protein [Gammaproteobacteria bacterium]|nr:MAG: EAL domain-containing protein [Gammaproteobacteria bacterium]